MKAVRTNQSASICKLDLMNCLFSEIRLPSENMLKLLQVHYILKFLKQVGCGKIIFM